MIRWTKHLSLLAVASMIIGIAGCSGDREDTVKEVDVEESAAQSKSYEQQMKEQMSNMKGKRR